MKKGVIEFSMENQCLETIGTWEGQVQGRDVLGIEPGTRLLETASEEPSSARMDVRVDPLDVQLPKANQQINEAARPQKHYPTTRLTLAALSPLGPCWHSNSTESPSFSVL